METTTIKGSDVKIERSRYGRSLVRITQDGDLIVVEDTDTEEFIAAIRKHTPTIEEPAPTPENVTNGVDLRMTLMISKMNRNQLRRDIAYEEGRINVIESLLEE